MSTVPPRGALFGAPSGTRTHNPKGISFLNLRVYQNFHLPGLEPDSQGWKPCILTHILQGHLIGAGDRGRTCTGFQPTRVWILRVYQTSPLPHKNWEKIEIRMPSKGAFPIRISGESWIWTNDEPNIYATVFVLLIICSVFTHGIWHVVEIIILIGICLPANIF